MGGGGDAMMAELEAAQCKGRKGVIMRKIGCVGRRMKGRAGMWWRTIWGRTQRLSWDRGTRIWGLVVWIERVRRKKDCWKRFWCVH